MNRYIGGLMLALFLAPLTACEDENPGQGVAVVESEDLNRDCNNQRRDRNSRAPEECNGFDDDCNGIPDDGQLCPVGQYCAGNAGCALIPEEECNGRNDDMDAATDEGVLCPVGQYCAAQQGCLDIPAESCDDLDNDFDEAVDETFVGKGEPCSVGVGACSNEGVQVCSEDGQVLVCNAQPGEPTLELCDGLDNDCDGTADEGFGVGDLCVLGVGVCMTQGTVICNENGGASCNAIPAMPGVEIQNGFDDDCDGSVDEAVRCVLDTDCRNPCNPLAAQPCAEGWMCARKQTFNHDNTPFEDYTTCVPAGLPANYTVGCSFGATPEMPGLCTEGLDPEFDGEVALTEEECENGFDEDADGLVDVLDQDCWPDPVCVVDADCMLGEECLEGLCEPIEGFCFGNEDCPQGEFCSDNNLCELPDAPDTDGDGVADGNDLCPLNPDPMQQDADLDGVGDACDTCPNTPNPGQEEDDDCDGVTDANDNCPAHANPGQENADNDGLGDLCDPVFNCDGNEDCPMGQVCGAMEVCEDAPLPPAEDCNGNEDCAQGSVCIAGECLAAPEGQCAPFAVEVTTGIGPFDAQFQWYGPLLPTRSGELPDGLHRSVGNECSVEVFDFTTCTCHTRSGESPCGILPQSAGVLGCWHNKAGVRPPAPPPN
jgi:hypothetical protein